MSAVAPKSIPAVPAETIGRIADFLRGFSIEATRPTPAELDALKSDADAVTQVYLSAVPAHPLSAPVGYAVNTHATGLEPIPHLAARRIESASALDDLLARLAAEAGVRRLLIIAGDNDQSTGPYTSAIEVIESGLLQRYGIAEV